MITHDPEKSKAVIFIQKLPWRCFNVHVRWRGRPNMISELLAYDFMQRAILAVIAISIFSPILGLFS